MKTTPKPIAARRRLQTAFAVILGTNEIRLGGGGLPHSCWMEHGALPRSGSSLYPAPHGLSRYVVGDPAEVDGLKAENAETSLDIAALLARGDCAVVTRLGLLDLIPMSTIHILIDFRMQKHQITPDIRHLARLTVGIGPEFTVAGNCDIAIETHPSKNGTILSSGRTGRADGKARMLGGSGAERFVYSEAPGRWHCAVEIGTRVFRNFPIGVLNGAAVTAQFDGIVENRARRHQVPARVKLFD